jgi:hypothetical protein
LADGDAAVHEDGLAGDVGGSFAGEEEEGAVAKKKFDLVWQADTKISASAFLVNSVEQ